MKGDFNLSIPPLLSEKELITRIKKLRISKPNKEVMRQIIDGSYKDGGLVRGYHDGDAPTCAKMNEKDIEEGMLNGIPHMIRDSTEPLIKLAFDLARYSYWEGFYSQGTLTKPLRGVLAYLK